MKKSLKVVLTGLFLCPALLFSACGSPAQYLITTNPSDSNLGSVMEASDVNLNTKAEGTKITLTAKENQPTTNPFICWIKDYKLVVSNSKELGLTYNQTNAGNYTAVFDETSQNKMLFASLYNVAFNIDNDVQSENNYTNVEYTVKYAILSSGSTNYSVLTDGRYNLTETSVNTNNRSVLYFGKAGADYNYVIRVDVTLKNATGGQLIQPFEFDNFVNKNDFDSNGNLVVTKQDPTCGTLSLTFKKLNSSTHFDF